MLEVIATQLSHVQAVQASGAGRIELCSAMGSDGLTPSAGLVELAVQEEIEMMKADILHAKKCGAAGVVLGVLHENQTVDVAVLKELVQLAYPMDVTFHRAFDVCIEPQQALEDIIACGCTRILSSGQEKNCIEGKNLLLQMVEWADERIQIMPGAGINPETISQIFDPSFSEYHMSGLSSIKPEGKQSEFFGGQYQSDLQKIEKTAAFMRENQVSQ